MISFQIRPTRREDVTAVVDVINAYAIALQGGAEETVQSCLTGWDTPGLRLETDSVVAETDNGALIATAELWDIQDSHLRMYGYWRIHPDFENQGVEERLADWIEGRARMGVLLASVDARVSLIIRFADLDQSAQRVLARRGYLMVRQLVRMEVNLATKYGEAVPGLPELNIFPLDENRTEAVAQVLYEAFRDHWGTVPETFEQYRGRILHIFEYPEVSPDLSLIAMCGEEVVAAAICSSKTAENEKMGWVNLLGVKRTWRKRGMGEAVLRHVLANFQAYGLESAGLNVDAESLTGATRLYEKVGMRVTRRYLTFEKVLRDGIDFSVRQIAVNQ